MQRSKEIKGTYAIGNIANSWRFDRKYRDPQISLRDMREIPTLVYYQHWVCSICSG